MLGNGDAYTFTGQLLMKVDQAGDNTLTTAGSPAVPGIIPMVAGPVPAPVEPPIERMSS